MLREMYKIHPGLVGAAAGLLAGARYSMWWFGAKTAETGLSDAESIWFLVATTSVFICFPMIFIYFVNSAYLGLRTNASSSKADSWNIIAVISFCLSFGYAISFFVQIGQPTFISSETMWSLLVLYAAIIVAPLYLIYKLPWVNWDLLAMRDSLAATDAADRDNVDLEAKSMSTNLQLQHQPDSNQKGDRR